MIKGLTSKMNKKLHKVEVLLTDTLVSRQLFLQPPSQNPALINSLTNSVIFIQVSGQLLLWTPLWYPKGVCLQELHCG